MAIEREARVQAINLFRTLVLAAQREGNRLLGEGLKPLGLTPAQAEVLAVLAAAQPVSLIELGERLVCEAGSPSRLVAGLTHAGLVARRSDPQDARKALFSLTPRGEALGARAAAVEWEFCEELAGLLEGMPVDAAAHTLWRLVAHLPAGKALRRRLTE